MLFLQAICGAGDTECCARPCPPGEVTPLDPAPGVLSLVSMPLSTTRARRQPPKSRTSPNPVCVSTGFVVEGFRPARPSALSRSERTGGDYCPQCAYGFDDRPIWKDCGDKPPPHVTKKVLTRRDKRSLGGEPVLAVSVRPSVVAVENPLHVCAPVRGLTGRGTRAM